MKRIELVNGNLYFGDYTIINHFVKIFPTQSFIYSKEGGGYLEITNVPIEILIPVWQIANLIELPEIKKEQEEQVHEEGAKVGN